MILRRVIAHFRKQEWTAIALDFLIVVLGVFVGLQVNNLNEARADRAREGLILCRLAIDFDQIEADVRQHLADAQASQRKAEEIVTAAQRGMTLEDLDALDITAAMSLRVAPAGSPTYAQLVTSGDMALIRSEPLRRTLIDYHEQLARFQRADGSVTNMLLDGGAMVIDIQELSSDAVAALPERLQAGLRTRLESTEFFLAAHNIYSVNVTNLGWKATLVEAAERVGAALAPETSQCPGGAAP
jgi:hypothetical protein